MAAKHGKAKTKAKTKAPKPRRRRTATRGSARAAVGRTRSATIPSRLPVASRGTRPPTPLPLPTAEVVAAARAAGLHYAADRGPGIRRRRTGKGWSYVGPDGEAVRDEADLARIRSLAIPPAYTDVWINPDPRGHIQATGRDARGRKQYRYHPQWQEARGETKYGRMVEFAAALPDVRRRVAADLDRSGLPREKVVATIVRLLDETSIRIGNEEYARTNESYGLTTLRDSHVEVDGATVKFGFRGKSGKEHEIDVRDRKLARIVRRCQDLPGQCLFAYVDAEQEQQTADSGDVNDYLHAVAGEEFTAKDFRTWNGTVLAATELARLGPAATVKAGKANVLQAIDAVAARLGNTRAVSRKSYVHPAVFDAYLDGDLLPALRDAPAVAGLSVEEAAVLAFLRGHAAGDERSGKRAA